MGGTKSQRITSHQVSLKDYFKRQQDATDAWAQGGASGASSLAVPRLANGEAGEELYGQPHQ